MPPLYRELEQRGRGGEHAAEWEQIRPRHFRASLLVLGSSLREGSSIWEGWDNRKKARMRVERMLLTSNISP